MSDLELGAELDTTDILIGDPPASVMKGETLEAYVAENKKEMWASKEKQLIWKVSSKLSVSSNPAVN